MPGAGPVRQFIQQNSEADGSSATQVHSQENTTYTKVSIHSRVSNKNLNLKMQCSVSCYFFFQLKLLIININYNHTTLLIVLAKNGSPFFTIQKCHHISQ